VIKFITSVQNKFSNQLSSIIFIFNQMIFMPDAFESVYFLHCPKSNILRHRSAQENASDPKNLLWVEFISLVSWSAQGLFELRTPYFFLFRTGKAGFRNARTVLGHSPFYRKCFYKQVIYWHFFYFIQFQGVL